VSLSTHYYVLSLGAKTNRLFEAFRDALIEVENQGFPVTAPSSTSNFLDRDQLRELARIVDKCFVHYYMLDPLRLVVVGAREMQSALSSVTAHGTAVIARIEVDHTATHARDLGQIVWPVVKRAISGVRGRALGDLEASEGRGQMATGLEAVALELNKGLRATLLVEDDYHLRGSVGRTGQSPVVSPDVDVRDSLDDAVDVVIERVLESGGNVVFAPGGSLSDWNRIVLLLPGPEIA
jgi:hypothetical protein